jgi:DNA polymerase-3 subunit alpha
VKRGATAGRLAGTVTSAKERKTRTGNKMSVVQFSDMTGQYEAVMFSETLAQFRDLLVEGRSVVITVAAEDRPEGVNLRIQTAQALDEEAAKHQKALRVFLRDPAPLPSLSSQLRERGDSHVSVVVVKPDGQGEVEIELPSRYRVDPRIAAALRAVPGVVDVELV